jgi:hypothetical protein
MKMAVFWDVAPCNLVEVYRRFRGAFIIRVTMMETASTSETSTRLFGATIQKTAIFIHTAVRT